MGQMVLAMVDTVLDSALPQAGHGHPAPGGKLSSPVRLLMTLRAVPSGCPECRAPVGPALGASIACSLVNHALGTTKLSGDLSEQTRTAALAWQLPQPGLQAPDAHLPRLPGRSLG